MNLSLMAVASREDSPLYIAGYLIGFFGILFIALLISVFSFVVWVLMLIDIINRKDWKEDSDKILWLLLILLFGVTPAIVYYFVIKRPYDAKAKLTSNSPQT